MDGLSVGGNGEVETAGFHAAQRSEIRDRPREFGKSLL